MRHDRRKHTVILCWAPPRGHGSHHPLCAAVRLSPSGPAAASLQNHAAPERPERAVILDETDDRRPAPSSRSCTDRQVRTINRRWSCTDRQVKTSDRRRSCADRQVKTIKAAEGISEGISERQRKRSTKGWCRQNSCADSKRVAAKMGKRHYTKRSSLEELKSPRQHRVGPNPPNDRPRRIGKAAGRVCVFVFGAGVGSGFRCM